MTTFTDKKLREMTPENITGHPSVVEDEMRYDPPKWEPKMTTFTDKQLIKLYRYWTVRDLRTALACDPIGPHERAEIKRVLILRDVDPATIPE